jgi:hypothetical protein
MSLLEFLLSSWWDTWNKCFCPGWNSLKSFSQTIHLNFNCPLCTKTYILVKLDYDSISKPFHQGVNFISNEFTFSCFIFQGIFVSILYCFLSSDVRDAVRRQYRRFKARRSANALRRNLKGGSRNSRYFNGTYRLTSGSCDGVLMGDDQAIFAPPTHFRSKFRSESSRSAQSKSPSPETIHNILAPGNETPSPPPISGPGHHHHHHHHHNHHHHHQHNNQTSNIQQPHRHSNRSLASSTNTNVIRPTPVVLTTCKNYYTDSRSAYELSVNIPLREFNLLRN